MIVYEQIGPAHRATSGKMSLRKILAQRAFDNAAAVGISSWYRPSPAARLEGNHYFNVLSFLALPGWKGRVLAFLRREARGLRLQSNWGAETFERSNHLEVGLEEPLGIEILVRRGEVTAAVRTADGEAGSLVVRTSGEPLDLRGELELRLGNPDVPGQPGEVDHDPSSLPEPDAEWSFLRVEALAAGEKPQGLMAPEGKEAPKPRPEIDSSLLLLTASALGGPLVSGKSPADAAATAVEAALAARDLLEGA